MPQRKIGIALGLVVISITFFFCTNNKSSSSSHVYKNLNDTVQYVGMQVCTSCHSDVHQTFEHTGMGQSFDHATKAKSSARFDEHAYVYDSIKNFWYHPYWKNDSLFIKEFRIEGTDTIYRRTEKISYIVGSGQHTNSHIWLSEGFLYQAPLTFYTQLGIWDLPPGFGDGMNTRWSRVISVECMNCHNMYGKFDNNSENKFFTVKTGIECERCHGPGSIHVREKLEGIVVDTSKEIDYSIVNPKKLSRDLQVELCQRCHLQGISVLNDGKTFFDFRPGMKLNEVMNVFMPRYEGNPDKFIMASHADRMKQSKCYMQSQMTCLTCHNPHVSVKETASETFNATCTSCHTQINFCTLPEKERMAKNNNCFECHMPVSSTLDIPYVTVHDHRIQIPVSAKEKNTVIKFVGLQCMTTENPPDLLMVEGYLQTYEAFSPQPFLLDSAWLRLNKASTNGWQHESDLKLLNEFARYFYLKKDYDKLIALSSKLPSEKITDAWCAYRIGEAYYQTGDPEHALQYYSRAVELKGDELEFMNKKGSALVVLQKIDEAYSIFQAITKLQPKFAPAWCNLGYCALLKSDFTYSENCLKEALALDPDYEQALLNMSQLKLLQKKNFEAKELLERVLKINPQNKNAVEALKKI